MANVLKFVDLVNIPIGFGVEIRFVLNTNLLSDFFFLFFVCLFFVDENLIAEILLTRFSADDILYKFNKKPNRIENHQILFRIA